MARIQRNNSMLWEEELAEEREEPVVSGRKVGSPKKKDRRHWLTFLQVSVCVGILIAGVIMRLIGGEWFQSVRDWYFTHVNQSILPEEDWEQMQQQVLELFPTVPEEQDSEESQANSEGTDHP